MEKRTKIIIGVVAGIVLIGGGAMAYSMNKKKQRKAGMQDNLDDDFDFDTDSGSGSGSGSRSASSPTSPASTPSAPPAPAPPVWMSKKDTVSTYKSDKDRIKSICGRRRYSGKKKREWLACVAKNSGFDGGFETNDFYNFEGNYVEVNSMLTDLF